jgi:arylsulfatase
MGGHRGIWVDGWKAVTRHQPGTAYDDDRWELYHVGVDPSECHDLAADRPEKVEELVARWWEEAEAHGVLPLDDRTIELFGARFRERSQHPPTRRYVYYPPVSPIPAQAGPAIGGRSFTMTASIERPDGAEGVLFATGTENSGMSWFVQGDRLVFDYNFFGEHHVVESDRPVPTGATEVALRFVRRDDGAEATLVIGGEACGTLGLDKFMRMMSSVGPSVGYDHGSPVSPRYRAPFAFTGRLRRLEVDVDPAGKHRDAAAAGYAAEMSRQ